VRLVVKYGFLNPFRMRTCTKMVGGYPALAGAKS
jgi:hypothetical protein